jgi:hypothetical protein
MDPLKQLSHDMQSNVDSLYGKRGESDPTSALGKMAKYDVWFMVKQGGPVSKEDIAVLTLATHFQPQIIDARDLVQTKRKKSEWTGYHAEAMVLSGMLAFLSVDIRTKTFDEVKLILGSTGAGPTTICANAPCCKHCANLLAKVGVAYDSTSGKPGNTGWWNPFSDTVAGHGTSEFQKDIPGSD